ncbi:hypothetical protein T636_A1479 [Enterobacter hormaechei subsp. xiangfangensis]|nr:hypothetical protein T636_A1479 [Enterobacter hormaechei subsp. xiangfangensis]
MQFGALANVLIMLCITVWALYLIFHNKKAIPQPAAPGRSLPLLFQPLYACGWCPARAIA